MLYGKTACAPIFARPADRIDVGWENRQRIMFAHPMDKTDVL